VICCGALDMACMYLGVLVCDIGLPYMVLSVGYMDLVFGLLL